jgi:hypothetical protein
MELKTKPNITLYDLAEATWSCADTEVIGIYNGKPVMTHQFWAIVEVSNDFVHPMFINEINLATGVVVYTKPLEYDKQLFKTYDPDTPVTISDFYNMLKVSGVEFNEDGSIRYYTKHFKKAKLQVYNPEMTKVIAEFNATCEHDWCDAVPNPYEIVKCCDKCHEVKYKEELKWKK